MTKLNKFLWTTALLFSTLSIASASTTVPSLISSNQVWTAANSPYIVNNNVLINTGVSVKVMPGVTIQSTGNYKILVNGEFIASGTYDSIVNMDKIIFDFSYGCQGYDFVNQTGSNFRFCFFSGNYPNSIYTITLNTVPMQVKDCKFLNCYYAIYCAYNSHYDTIDLKVLNTIFDCNNNYNGYPVNVSGYNIFLEMDGCYIRNQYGVIIYTHSKITRCTFYNMLSYGGIRIMNANKFNPGETILKCNIFRKCRNSVLEFLGVDSFHKVTIEENTFDSADNFIIYSYFNKASCRPVIKNNNFLYYVNYSFKFGGGTAGQYEWFDMRNNFWGSTDTLKIAAGIYDFKDDITVSPLADYSSILTGPVSSCNESTFIRSIEKTGFRLNPNPVISNFTIIFNTPGRKTVYIYNMNGELILSENCNDYEMNIDVNSFADGLYWVEVLSDGKQSGVQKLSINR